MAAEGPQVAPGASSTPVPALVASVPNPKGAAMTAVILTAEQAAQVLAGVREFVVPGNITDGAVTLWKWDEGKPVRHPWRIVAPKQWADADGPCETCGGQHRTPPLTSRGAPFVCDDCLDGHKRVELRETCPTCDGSGEVFHLDYKDPTRKMWDQCPECSSHGTILVAWATVEMLPFRKWASHLDTPPGRWATMSPSGVFVIQSSNGHTLTTSPTRRRFDDPFPVPDRDFVAVLSDVELT